MGCMIGEVQAGVVVVKRIAPADVEPEESTPTRVIPKQTCERAGWSGTVGMIHSHPTGERCWYPLHCALTDPALEPSVAGLVGWIPFGHGEPARGGGNGGGGGAHPHRRPPR